MTQTRLYSTRTRKNRVGLLSCSRVVSNFASPSRDPAWKYCTHIEGNKNGTICNFCDMVIKSGGITRFKFHLSRTDPDSNSKKCHNVPLEVKKK